MSQTSTSGGTTGGARSAVPIVVGSILSLVALSLLIGGGWALWKDRVDRDDDGFVSLGSESFRTDTYAIVGDLRGDGPDWLYGSSTIGDIRVRGRSLGDGPLFVGIGPREDVRAYLDGVAYATVEGFDVSADTTRDGGPPPGPPSDESFWATSAERTGAHAMRWEPRSGRWTIVFMNADGSRGVGVRGDAAVELPILPWVAWGLLVAGAVAGFVAGLLVVVGLRRVGRSSRGTPTASGSVPTPA
jgi:hypothetical protein